jgi:tRNA U34 5-methylaminomethyl-2-thiouridine-forming methyltransferase MnmC
MSTPEIKLITTQDGSHSLLRTDINETYHSFHGARTESLYVFIEQCLDYFFGESQSSRISIFEVGFGTGLNALLAASYARDKGINIDFTTLEPIPVPLEIYQKLDFGFEAQEHEMILKMHQCDWEALQQLNERFALAKHKTTLELFETSEQYDLLFFDAFAPSKQAEVWELSNIEKCYGLLKTGGVLTTYCAQGQFKRNLAAAGFEVETLKGAMEKKEMVRAHKLN